MMYLDLDEIDDVLALSPWWSKKYWNLARFKRSDYFGNPDRTIKDEVINRLKNEGIFIDGAVRMLSNLRYFGFIINPITVYYCFDRQEQLQAMLVEVTNTPWGEKHDYVLPCDPNKKYQRIVFDKQLHVSPFNPMNMYYKWRSNNPMAALGIHMQNRQDINARDSCVFDATLRLNKMTISAKKLQQLIFIYPFMTLKVMAAIYWQASRLFLKRTPIYSNPKSL
jgi:hypothetical protein